jgi:adenylate cyclase
MSTITAFPARQAGPAPALPETPVPGVAVEVNQPRAHTATIRGTERKSVTVLFADVGGSMALSGSIGLEEWWSMIATLFELMSEAVQRCGGWVGAFTGDGISAVFEAHGGAEEHARRACQAALSIRDAMQEPAAALRRERRLELAVRIGINSGEVVTGTVGARCSPYYTACGYTVGLAKRMEALATPDRIFLTEHSAALIGHTLPLHDCGAFEVKGAPCPVGVYELLEREADDDDYSH